MISPRQAVTYASNYLTLVYEGRIGDLRVEEIDPASNGEYWLVTMSFVPANLPPALTLRGEGREYKDLKINSENGDVMSMKIRKIA
jgi:hypothetical protein